MDIGVFIPINNNGWIISATSPQYMPSFELNKQVVQKAEAFGFDFALSMIKLHGFGGPTEFWDHGLESFTLMAGLASVTSRIKLYASVAVLTLPPAMVARMTSTISDISGGRFGVNIVSGWHKIEYSQMGLWPGDDYFGRRYDYSTEYVRVLRELWEAGQSDFQGEHFRMEACKLSPRPAHPVKVVAAGQSDRGMEFAAQYCDFNFAFGQGFNTPLAAAGTPARLQLYASRTGRDVGTYMLFMVIAAETDAAAVAKWDRYTAGADKAAIAYMIGKAADDPAAPDNSSVAALQRSPSPINLNMGTLAGSYAHVAAMLDEAASMPGVAGIMLTFDDFLAGMDEFGERIQPLMRCRSGRQAGTAAL